ncbi:MAG: hypothetical protein JOZ07_12420 [Solirubrobacterales bacterium]|nr:hypothetical protein [Solirubrobacterales bacterium]
MREAKGKQRVLDQALHASRFDGEYLERQDANLIFRLLKAAAHHQAAIEPTSPDDAPRIQAVEAFLALPEDERWTRDHPGTTHG